MYNICIVLYYRSERPSRKSAITSQVLWELDRVQRMIRSWSRHSLPACLCLRYPSQTLRCSATIPTWRLLWRCSRPSTEGPAGQARHRLQRTASSLGPTPHCLLMRSADARPRSASPALHEHQQRLDTRPRSASPAPHEHQQRTRRLSPFKDPLSHR